jgi:hypothetical protein
MSDRMPCEQVREIAPEIALGVADGQERDGALRHLAGCAECRSVVAEYSAVADELLLLAPSHEPPPGFEARTLALLGEPKRAVRARSWWRPLSVAAAIVIAGLLAAGAVLHATAGDRRVADAYRAVLAEGNGSFFDVATIRGSSGDIGSVFGYQGSPSWVYATLRAPMPSERRFEVELVTSDGRTLSLGPAVMGGDVTGWGAVLPVDLASVSELHFLDANGKPVLTASFGETSPWEL